jgi:hypothetical protein
MRGVDRRELQLEGLRLTSVYEVRRELPFFPLPEGRGAGPYPLTRAILEARDFWAITCHKLSEKFDEGIPCSPQEPKILG